MNNRYLEAVLKRLGVVPKSVERIQISGGFIGSPLSVYDPKIIYVAESGSMAYDGSAPSPTPGQIRFKSNTGNVHFYASNNIPVVDGGVLKFSLPNIDLKDIWFSCMEVDRYLFVNFQGYKITYN